MISSLKSEFRKLLTVRSTYLILAIAVALVVLFAFYIEGYKAEPAKLANPFLLSGQIASAVSVVSVLGAIVGIILMTNEYRYNTIMYTLTASNSRNKTLLAKIVAITIFAIAFTAFIAALSPLMTLLGVHMQGKELAVQTIYYQDIWWRVLLFGWWYSIIGLLLATLLRHIAAAIATLLLVPTMVEPLLGIWLKQDSVYLPFNAITAVISKTHIAYNEAAFVSLAYLTGGWIVAWLFFSYRDAS